MHPRPQVCSKRCFHELRTKQRLGYSVSLSLQRLQHTLGAAVRIQSPAVAPAELQARVAGWLGMLRGELEALPLQELEHHKQVGGAQR